MDDDDQGDDPESDPDEEEYLSDEVLNENDFISDPYFYQEIIPEIEVRVYNPRLPEPDNWPVDLPSFPMPLEIHPDPLPIIDDNEFCHQASIKAFVVQDASSSSMQDRLENGQEGGSGKDNCLITKQDILFTSIPSDPSTLRISTSEVKDDRQNAPLKDAIVTTIVSSSNSVTTKTHGVITLDVEPADLINEPEVTSCYVATSI
ncbi:hypothetical protein AAC387_Pa10g0398 [Persea americana]